MIRYALLFSLLAGPAVAFQARNDARVTGTADQIVVAARPGLSGPESWCAAGEFVVRILDMPSATRIYRVSPPPRRSGEDVIFSLSPEGAAARTGLLRIGATENSVSAGHARALCDPGRPWF